LSSSAARRRFLREELRLDYEDFLRQRGLETWPPEHPALRRFKARRCATLEQVRAWVEEERTRTLTDSHRRTQPAPAPTVVVSVREGPCPSVRSAELAANAALSLLNLCCYLLDRQLQTQAATFEKEGGFTERLYRVRSERRK
jgi:four helix bundle suffix protein